MEWNEWERKINFITKLLFINNNKIAKQIVFPERRRFGTSVTSKAKSKFKENFKICQMKGERIGWTSTAKRRKVVAIPLIC